MKKKILLTLTAMLSTCMLAFTLTGCFDSPHTCVFDKEISAGQFLKSEATCENKAVYYYSCECGKSGTQTFEFGSALGHYYEYHSLGDGTHEKVCLNDPSDVTIEDCTTGEIVCQQQPVCSVCFEICGEPREHDFSKQIVSQNTLREPATCTTSANYYYSCECGVTGCDDYFSYGEPLEHEFVDYVSNNDATCEENGTKTAYCNRDNCNEFETIEDVDSALGHAYGEYIYNNDGTHYRVCANNESHVDSGSCGGGEATCTSKAYCSTCNEPYENKLSHTFEDDECAVCGTKVGSQGLEFKLMNYGKEYFVDGLGTCQDLDIIIPDEHNNIPVTGIEGNAFSGTNIKSVWMPYSIYVIQTSVFENCTSLTSVTIGEGLRTVWVDAFKNCKALESVNYTSIIDKWVNINFETETANPLNNGADLYIDNELLTNVELSTATTISKYAFYNYDNIESVTLPNTIKSVGSYAFYNCENINKVNYLGTIDEWVSIGFGSNTSNPIRYGAGLYVDNELVTNVVLNNATYISSCAFYGYDYIESVTIPNSVKSIGSYVFRSCDNLNSVNYLGTIDEWVEMSFAASPMGRAPLIINGQTVVDVNLTTATKISAYAFEGYKYLRSVTMGSSVKSIGEHAFKDCNSLATITIGSKVGSIRFDAFENCYRLVEVINNSTYITVDKETAKSGDLGYYPDIIVNRDSEYQSELYENNGFVILSSGQEKILVNYVGDQTELVLPSEITKINDFALAYNNNLTKIVMDNNVTRIDDYAFYENTKLNDIVFSTNLSRIGEKNVFYGCALECKVKDGLKYYGNDDYLVYLVGVENKNIQTATIDSNCVSINEFAFDMCSSLKSLVIPNGVTSIGSYAFRSSGLTSIEIPSSVTYIGERAFADCFYLNKVNYLGTADEWVQIRFVDSYSNPTYYAKNLYINDELVTDVVLTTATKISHSAFFNCESLESIYIPKTVTTVGRSAFAGCTSLTIYCEVDEKPTGWDDEFNYSNCQILWGQQKDS